MPKELNKKFRRGYIEKQNSFQKYEDAKKKLFDQIQNKEEYKQRGELDKYYQNENKNMELILEEKSELMNTPSPLFKIVTKGENIKQFQNFIQEKWKLEDKLEKVDVNFTKGQPLRLQKRYDEIEAEKQMRQQVRQKKKNRRFKKGSSNNMSFGNFKGSSRKMIFNQTI